MYNKGPAHNLNTHIKELGYHTLAIIVYLADALQCSQWVHIMILVGIMRHLGEVDYEEHQCYHRSDNQVGRNQHAQVAVSHGGKLCIAQQSALLR